ncbi:MAG: DUF2092 domain-containing protein [Burkholderiales bacterium]|nr:DUF2092 domain-containing protein [Burkholderiales bacterium]
MLRAGLILATSLLATNVAWAETATPATETESQQFARARLMEMAQFLSGAEKFSVTLRVGYDVVQADGQKIEFGEIRELSVHRSDQARIAETSSDGKHDLLLFDGKHVTTFDGATKRYAQAPQPGDLDATAIYFVRDLQMRLPLAPMFTQQFPQELQRRVKHIDYVERTTILGVPTHHIAARTENVDFQVWIADGKQPLPLRVVLSYPAAEGQPQFWANFSKWNMSPRFGKSTFAFKPPADAKQIPFAVQLLPQSGAPSLNQGGKP